MHLESPDEGKEHAPTAFPGAQQHFAGGAVPQLAMRDDGVHIAAGRAAEEARTADGVQCQPVALTQFVPMGRRIVRRSGRSAGSIRARLLVADAHGDAIAAVAAFVMHNGGQLPHEMQAEAAVGCLLQRARLRRRGLRQGIEGRTRVDHRERGSRLIQQQLEPNLAGLAAVRVVDDVGHQLAGAKIEVEEVLIGKPVAASQAPQPGAGGPDGSGGAIELQAVETEAVGHPARLARAVSTSATTGIS